MSQSRSQKSRKQASLKASRISIQQKISPVKSQHYQTLNQNKKQIIDKLLYVFTFYSSKISKYSYRELNEKYFIHLISDLYEVKNGKELPKNSVEQKEFLNIYFSKGKKNIGSGIKFEQFLQTLPTVSVYLCPEIDEREEAVKNVMKALLMLYELKVSEYIESHFVQFDNPINDQTKQMVLKLSQSFNTVYKIYFSHEIVGKFNTNDPSHQSFEALSNMMKDFDVYPKLISGASLYLLYHSTLKATFNNLLHQTHYIKERMQEKGQLFTLSKMIELLISCSRLCYNKLKNLQNPEYDSAYQKQVLKTLLEYMETIKSTKTSLKTSTIFKENRFTFILLEEYENEDSQKMTKTFILKDKIVKESQKQMEFFTLFDRIQL